MRTASRNTQSSLTWEETKKCIDACIHMLIMKAMPHTVNILHRIIAQVPQNRTNHPRWTEKQGSVELERDTQGAKGIAKEIARELKQNKHVIQQRSADVREAK